MRKLSDHIDIAAAEYWQETGNAELSPRWSAEYFQDCGVMDDYPEQNLIGFHALVQKALTLNIERAEKIARLQCEKSSRNMP
ncbi:MAG: hypothetical protein PHQ60_06400 [Sideroxydans sp.]|nr:hypothetical protein [Sideroxydans sp.]